MSRSDILMMLLKLVKKWLVKELIIKRLELIIVKQREHIHQHQDNIMEEEQIGTIDMTIMIEEIDIEIEETMIIAVDEKIIIEQIGIDEIVQGEVEVQVEINTVLGDQEVLEEVEEVKVLNIEKVDHLIGKVDEVRHRGDIGKEFFY